MILGHERFERNHGLGTRIKRVLALHGLAHRSERLAGKKNDNPQRHQVGRQNQDDNKAAVIAFQIKMQPTFSTRPIRLTAHSGYVENSSSPSIIIMQVS